MELVHGEVTKTFWVFTDASSEHWSGTWLNFPFWTLMLSPRIHSMSALQVVPTVETERNKAGCGFSPFTNENSLILLFDLPLFSTTLLYTMLCKGFGESFWFLAYNWRVPAYGKTRHECGDLPSRWSASLTKGPLLSVPSILRYPIQSLNGLYHWLLLLPSNMQEPSWLVCR